MNRVADKISAWMERGYTLAFALLFLLYIGFSALPPFLAFTGHETSSNIGYMAFRYLCHQLPYRSFFLFGEQRYYPLENAKLEEFTSFEQAIAETEGSVSNLRDFIGNERMGWKMAICQRDIAIFAFMALYCFISFASHNRIRGIPLWLWLALGILPMGLDGGTQLLSRILPQIVPLRESTPLLRVVTGALFGWFSCWYLMPRLGDSLTDELPQNNGEES